MAELYDCWLLIVSAWLGFGLEVAEIVAVCVPQQRLFWDCLRIFGHAIAIFLNPLDKYDSCILFRRVESGSLFSLSLAAFSKCGYLRQPASYVPKMSLLLPILLITCYTIKG
jgi:hypothetical protein